MFCKLKELIIVGEYRSDCEQIFDYVNVTSSILYILISIDTQSVKVNNCHVLSIYFIKFPKKFVISFATKKKTFCLSIFL